MKINELREMTVDELQQKHEELEEELFNLRFQASTGQIENPIKMRSIRRDIARILTLLGEMKLEQPETQTISEEIKSHDAGDNEKT
jgi:large subunit ribosomal protein L29